MNEANRHRLSDKAWRRLSGVLDRLCSRRGRSGFDDRRFVDGVFWMLRTGAPWRDLPCDFGRRQTAYKRLSRWTQRGIWAAVYRQSRPCLHLAKRVHSLDSTSIRVHQHGAPRRRDEQAQSVGTSRGGKTTKLHLLASAGRKGQLLALRGMLSAGQMSDIAAVPEVLRRLPPLVRRLAADNAYDAGWLRSWLARRGMRAIVPYRRYTLRPKPLDRQAYAKRNEVERLFARLKHFRRVATRYDRLATQFAGFVQLGLIASRVYAAASTALTRGV